MDLPAVPESTHKVLLVLAVAFVGALFVKVWGLSEEMQATYVERQRLQIELQSYNKNDFTKLDQFRQELKEIDKLVKDGVLSREFKLEVQRATWNERVKKQLRQEELKTILSGMDGKQTFLYTQAILSGVVFVGLFLAFRKPVEFVLVSYIRADHRANCLQTAQIVEMLSKLSDADRMLYESLLDDDNHAVRSALGPVDPNRHQRIMKFVEVVEKLDPETLALLDQIRKFAENTKNTPSHENEKGDS